MMKKLLNYSEDKTFKELLNIADGAALCVFAKVRVADVLPIERSGIADAEYKYALMAHFDFTVATPEHVPLFAVEFDGPGHADPRQKARDALKDGLCRRFTFPILHINSKHLSHVYNNRTLLAWIIEVYLQQEAFGEAQEVGYIPWDEPFDPFFIMSSGGDRKEKFPFWISRSSRLRMQQLHEAGQLRDFGSSGMIWNDTEDLMRGLEYVRVTETHGLSVEASMREQQFPVVLSDLLDELLTIFMMEKIDRHLAGEIGLEPMEPVYDRVTKMFNSGRMRRCHSVGSPPSRVAT